MSEAFSNVRRTLLVRALVCAGVVLTPACAPMSVQRTQKDLGPPVYPAPPDEPRFVYERTIYSSGDIAIDSGTLGFRRLLTGETRRGEVLNKPNAVAVSQGRIFLSDSAEGVIRVFDVPNGRHFKIGADAARAVTIADALASSALTSVSDEKSVNHEPLRGPLVIAFWATWCAPCRSEMPALERLSQRLRERGINVVGITLDDDLNLAREFARSHRLTFPVYAEGGDRVVQSALGVKTLPHTVLVTGDGTVAASLSGARDWDAPAMERRLLKDVLGLAYEGSTETNRGAGMRRRLE